MGNDQSKNSGCRNLIGLMAIGAILLIPIVLIIEGGGGSNNNTTQTSEATPIEKITAVFKGDYPENKVRTQVYLAIQNYRFDQNDSDRMKVADKVHAARKTTGVEEMKLLNCANQDGVVESEISFEEAVASCATIIEDSS